MVRTAASLSGESLDRAEGFPSLRSLGRRFGVQAGLVGAVIGLGLALGSVAAAQWGFADAGYESHDSVITWVDRTGFAWLDGIRSGQHVVSIRGESLAQPDGTVLVTESGGRRFTSRSGDYDKQLRPTLPLGVLAMIVGLVAVPLALARRSWSGVLVMIAVLLASTPLERLYDRDASTAALAATVIAPTLFLATRPRLRGPIRVTIAVLGLGFVVAWIITRLLGVAAHEPLDAVRGTVAFSGVVVATGLELVGSLRRSDAPASNPIQLVDALSLAVGAGAIVALLYFRGLDPVALALIVGGVLLYPRFRRLTTRAADRLLLSDLRERAAIESAEEERARLARDLHDTSLQELAGVISQLETRPDTRAEGAALRRVAEQLRRVTSELRPPVLDDLGLAAAVGFIADRTRTPDLSVDLRVDDRTGLERSTRAPANVELAVYRIVEQALSNVVLHSAATQVNIAGIVRAEEVLISILDNGRGLTSADLQEAARRGRLGLASMRRRAELIGASLDVEGTPGRGTLVTVRWHQG